MKAENSTALQQEQATQRSNAHKSRAATQATGPTPDQPFANLLASMGQAVTSEDDLQTTDPTQADAQDLLSPDAAALAALLAQQAMGNGNSDETPVTESATATQAQRRGRGVAVGLLSTAELQQGQDHRAPGRSVSAMAQSDDRTLPPPQALVAQSPTSETTQTSWHMLTPGHPGSALPTEQASADTPAPPAAEDPTTALIDSNKTSVDTQASGSGGGELGTNDSTGNNGTDVASSQDTATPDNFAQNLEHAMDNLGAQVSYWASNNIRRATMRLDAGLRAPLEVDVRLKDGVAQLDFRTNDAQARETIQAQAPAVLADLLARSGIGLEGLSVGANGNQDRGGAQYGDASSQQWTALGSQGPRNEGQSTAASVSPASRNQPQGALDVFA